MQIQDYKIKEINTKKLNIALQNHNNNLDNEVLINNIKFIIKETVIELINKDPNNLKSALFQNAVIDTINNMYNWELSHNDIEFYFDVSGHENIIYRVIFNREIKINNLVIKEFSTFGGYVWEGK